MASVGIITGLTWASGDPFRTWFETGYGSSPPYAGGSPVEIGGDYDSNGRRNRKSYRQVAALDDPATVLVAVGGLVAAHPVVQRTTKSPFLVLVGRIPEASDFSFTDNDNYCGGVELHMVQDNTKRRAALMAQFSLGDPSKIFLLFNPNSRMGQSEANEWRAQGGDAIPAAMQGFNDVNEFGPAFTRLKNRNATGVVVSSDPFFMSKRSDLVTAANAAFTDFGIKVCYPSDLFGSPTAPKSGSAISFGPDFKAAYTAMGQKAKAVVTAGSAKFVGLDTASLPANPTVY
jgi:hypothetical protein